MDLPSSYKSSIFTSFFDQFINLDYSFSKTDQQSCSFFNHNTGFGTLPYFEVVVEFSIQSFCPFGSV